MTVRWIMFSLPSSIVFLFLERNKTIGDFLPKINVKVSKLYYILMMQICGHVHSSTTRIVHQSLWLYLTTVNWDQKCLLFVPQLPLMKTFKLLFLAFSQAMLSMDKEIVFWVQWTNIILDFFELKGFNQSWKILRWSVHSNIQHFRKQLFKLSIVDTLKDIDFVIRPISSQISLLAWLSGRSLKSWPELYVQQVFR